MIMHNAAAEARLAASKQARYIVGPPASMPHIAAAVARLPWNAECDVITGRGDHAPDLTTQCVGHPFVGIQREHPVAPSELDGAIALRPRARPIRCHVH